MTGNGAKIWTGDEKSPVEVRRKNAKMLGLRRIGLFGGLSARLMGHIGDEAP
jgi:hypothetical protein